MSEPILQVKNLAITFKSNHNSNIVKNINFSLKKGETLALVGESGSGKSITALSILKLLPYPNASHPSGEVLFENNDLLKASESHLRSVRGNKISMIFQEPMTALNPLHTLEKQIAEVLFLHQRLNRNEARKKVITLLSEVGIKDPETRLQNYPHELSGGQRQRVMIAMALANSPQILIADEPTTALDVTVQKQVLDLIEELKKRFNLAVLLISHDLGVVKHYSQDVAIMKHGEIVEYGSSEAIFGNPQHEYTQQLIASAPSGRPHPCQNRTPYLEATQLNVRFPIKRSFWGKTLRELAAVSSVDLSVPKGSTLGIIGESGSGKSTLAMALIRLQQSSGVINLNDKRIDNLNYQEMLPIRKTLQAVFQDPFASLSPRLTIAQIISEGLEIHTQFTAAEIDAAVVSVLQEVGLDPQTRHRYPHEFSGGQRQRVAIARALVLKPEVVILDEPTSALDRTVQGQIIELLRGLQARHDLTYLFISHDISVIKAMSHKIAVMREGKIVEFGETDTVLNSPKTEYTRTLLDATLI